MSSSSKTQQPEGQLATQRSQRRRGGLELDPGWACPFFRYDWKAHLECRFMKMSRVSDVRQHLQRNHDLSEGVRNEMKKKENQQGSNEDRWIAIWRILFPTLGEQELDPQLYRYTGSVFADLSKLFVDNFIEGCGTMSNSDATLLENVDIGATLNQRVQAPGPVSPTFGVSGTGPSFLDFSSSALAVPQPWTGDNPYNVFNTTQPPVDFAQRAYQPDQLWNQLAHRQPEYMSVVSSEEQCAGHSSDMIPNQQSEWNWVEQTGYSAFEGGGPLNSLHDHQA